MGSARQGWRFTPRGGGRPPGFVLVEMLLGLVVVVLAAVLVFSVLGRLRHRARVHAVAATLRAAATAVESFRSETGRWPATTTEAGSRLPDGTWPPPPSLGGEYGWMPPAGPGRSGLVTLTAFAPRAPLDLTRDDLLALDRRIDDGNLASGRLRKGFNGWPVYLVEEQP